MAIKCDKCGCDDMGPNSEDTVNYQTIHLFDEEYHLCNNCATDVVSFITGVEPEED